MVARPAPNFPDALARSPQPLKFVPVDEHLALDDGSMHVDVYHVLGHLHMAEAVFAYIPERRILLEGDFTTFNWDYNWWGRRVSRQRRALRARSRDQHPGARQGDDFQGDHRDDREAGRDREEVLRDEREGGRLSCGVSGAVLARRGALT